MGMVMVINGVAGKLQPTSVFIREPTHLLTDHGCFYTIEAELGSRERNLWLSKAGDIYSVPFLGSKMGRFNALLVEGACSFSSIKINVKPLQPSI